MQRILRLTALIFGINSAFAQNIPNNPKSNHGNKFEQLGGILADPNEYRAASGAPGHAYWQQKADYIIKAELLETQRVLKGEEQITYHNQSPDALDYLWLQLDENEHSPTGESNYFNESKFQQPLTPDQLNGLDVKELLAGYGVNIEWVKDAKNKPLPYVINYTMMRIDLPKPLKPGEKFVFKIKWDYKIPERMKIGGRGGYEFFKEDGSCLFTISQWYPRMCVYSDYQGWNHKQFTGRGEFSLVFGDFDVSMTVPADHIIASTGECVNYNEVLSPEQLSRWKVAQTANNPVQIVTLDEALNKEKNPVIDPTDKNSMLKKTWRYTAKNVRDFAWGSSRKFTWDAMAVNVEGKKVMCMSYYPKESYALYNKYSTKVVAHTILTYSKYTIPYQYPVAISVEASSGMEYPMICFNYGRTDKEGNYSKETKYGMIGVIIHEVGHNFFPMIINSDERQWSWMDEGLNTFVQFLAEQEFDNNYPSRRGPAHKIVDYMKLPTERLEPIMTNSENIIEFGPNAYAKPATALNILRETIMGRTLFDHAFKTYCERWAYKHPTPSDFFRTMEDASGVDLDWFWRAWFYDIEPVDIALDSVIAFKVYSPEKMPLKTDSLENAKLEAIAVPGNPRRRNRNLAPQQEDTYLHLSRLRNKAEKMSFAVDRDTTLRDFYDTYNPKIDTAADQYYEMNRQRDTAQKVNANLKYPNLTQLTPEELSKYANNYYYELTLKNLGGAVMPVIIRWNFVDGTYEVEYISAYIWRKNEDKITKGFVKYKEVASIVIDPFRETADINENNNHWPGVKSLSRYEIYKSKTGEGESQSNPMKRHKDFRKKTFRKF